VFTRYRSEPTMLLYAVVSMAGAVLFLLSLRRGSMGMQLGLHLANPAFWRIFAAYAL
jgi:hypothetical protein